MSPEVSAALIQMDVCIMFGLYHRKVKKKGLLTDFSSPARISGLQGRYAGYMNSPSGSLIHETALKVHISLGPDRDGPGESC